MLWILLGYVLSVSVLNHSCICCIHIGSAMTENIPEADPEYAGVAKDYEDHGVPEAFTNFRCPVPTQGKPLCITPTF
jgi:hypothetical protein